MIFLNHIGYYGSSVTMLLWSSTCPSTKKNTIGSGMEWKWMETEMEKWMVKQKEMEIKCELVYRLNNNP